MTEKSGKQSAPGQDAPQADPTQVFNLSDFDSGRVFEYLYSIEDPFHQAMVERRLQCRADEVKFKNFKRLFALYKQTKKAQSLPIISQAQVSSFDGQAVELDTGEWTADETGIYRPKGQQMEIACSHPIYPARRLRSIDTSLIKYELRFKPGLLSFWMPPTWQAQQTS